MSRSSAHTWLFCELCGTMLSFDSPTYASCSFCNAQHDVKDFQGREIWYTLGAEDMIRRLGIEPLIKPESDPKVVKSSEEIQQRAMVNDECPKCKHPHLEYYTSCGLQMKARLYFMNARTATTNFLKTCSCAAAIVLYLDF
ncbi:hypothetical protein O6H91_10G059500 [Diphasiastrum complanatum]|uniref:Uncharacterized protein n=1 Tax=Diphasiastrum complanatum TaxID=34168 RepID=A0ACC2CHF5_DIPCM|nr:hypothetical protein O6H91_10G059500 [Diphasiastrum complanatum]